MESDDRMTVAIALAAICRMEDNRSTDAEELLARPLGTYYVIYGPPDHPNKQISEDRVKVLRQIEEAARSYPVVQAAIEKSKENLRK